MAVERAQDAPYVLVADAETAARARYRRMMAFQGCVVVEASDGYEAMLKLIAVPPRLVIADLHLPLLDGVALSTLLRRNPATAGVPVLLVAAEGSDPAVSRARSAGADVVLPKRAPVETLLRESRRLLAMAQGTCDAADPAPPPGGPASLRRNRLLRALPEDEYAALAPQLTRVALSPKRVLHRTGQPIDRLLFPDGGMISLVTPLDDGSTIESATAGNRGVVGVPALRTRDATSPFDCVVQIGGADALTLRTIDLRRDAARLPVLWGLLDRHVQVVMTQVAQTNACNALHPVAQRCARWLLTARDHVASSEFALSHEFLAQMLAVQRPTVSEVAAVLQGEGLIRYRRGAITILDGGRLGARACECYAAVRRSLDSAAVVEPAPPGVAGGRGRV